MRRLRWQLICVLLLVALLPAIPAAWTVRELFQRSVAGSAETEVLAGAHAGLLAVRVRLDDEKQKFAARVLEGAPLDTLLSSGIASLNAAERRAATTALEQAIPPATGFLAGPARATLRGQESLVGEIRATGETVWVTAPLPADLVEQAAALTSSIQLLETLRRDRGAVVRGLLLTFLFVYGVILGLVVLLGLLLASRLTRPLEALGAGIDRVAEGDLDTRVASARGGPLARLIERFNGMTARIGDQQDELIRLEKLAVWRNLARHLAHEIKNPLTPIQLAAQQMRDSYSGPDEAHAGVLREGTEIVEEEVRSLRTLVREFSEFARLPEPKMQQTRVSELLDDAAALYGEEKVTCTADPALETSHVWCDPGEIHRVLINLINNGLQAQGERGVAQPVQLRAVPSGDDRVAIEVRDHGPGVPLERRKTIFAPDFSTKTDGMGLGLAIVEGIVRAHGGSILVDGDDHGAVFTFTLAGKPFTQDSGDEHA